jgi:hypothetical protein
VLRVAGALAAVKELARELRRRLVNKKHTAATVVAAYYEEA